MNYQPQNYILGSQPPSRQNSHGMPQADDGTGFLLANAISLGGRSGSFGMPGALPDTNSGGGFNFDMEWAYYSMIEQPGQQQDAAANIAMRDGTGNGIVPLTIDAIPTGVGAGVGDLAVINERVEKRKLEVDEEATQADSEPKRSKRKAVWRKYGQKTLKGKDYTGMKMLRCYYRCNHPGCQVKKQVMPLFQVVCQLLSLSHCLYFWVSRSRCVSLATCLALCATCVCHSLFARSKLLHGQTKWPMSQFTVSTIIKSSRQQMTKSPQQRDKTRPSPPYRSATSPLSDLI